MRRSWRVGAVAAALVAALAPSAHAAAGTSDDDPVRFSVTPSRLEVQVAPGDTLQFAIQAINHAAEPLRLLTYVDDVDIPQHDLLEPDELAFTASRWLQLADDQVVVPPGAAVDVVVTVDVPEGTPTGGYHALAYFQATGEGPAGNGIAAQGRIGATVLLEVTPDDSGLHRDARVAQTDLEVSWEGLLRPTVDAAVTLDNVGDLHVVAGAVHTYRSWPDQGVVEQKVDPVAVLRGTRRTFTSSTSAVPILGKVTLTSELVYQVSPEDLPVIVTQATVWIIPWHLLVAAGAAAAVVWLLRRWWRRRARAPAAATGVDGPPADDSTAAPSPIQEEVPTP